jgi:hypothetical protein
VRPDGVERLSVRPDDHESTETQTIAAIASATSSAASMPSRASSSSRCGSGSASKREPTPTRLRANGDVDSPPRLPPLDRAQNGEPSGPSVPRAGPTKETARHGRTARRREEHRKRRRVKVGPSGTERASRDRRRSRARDLVNRESRARESLCPGSCGSTGPIIPTRGRNAGRPGRRTPLDPTTSGAPAPGSAYAPGRTLAELCSTFFPS